MLAGDRFIPLAEWLAGPPDVGAPDAAAPREEPEAAAVPAASKSPRRADLSASSAEPTAPMTSSVELLRDVRLFRARLAERLDRATAELIRDLAYAVLGRELALAPADVAAIAARIVAEHPAAVPVRIHHAAGDRCEIGHPTVVDANLAPGDVRVAFADGEVDARLGLRLAVVLEALA